MALMRGMLLEYLPIRVYDGVDAGHATEVPPRTGLQAERFILSTGRSPPPATGGALT